MKLTKEQVIKKIKYGQFLEKFPEWNDDKKVVLEAVEKDGYNLRFTSDRLKDDKEVVLEGLKKTGWVLQFASDRLKKELLPQTLKSMKYKECLEPIEIVKYDGFYLCLLTTEVQNNKEIVLEAIKQKEYCFQFASQEIKNKIGNKNPVLFLEQWIKNEKQQEYLNQQLDKKENVGKIKI